MIFSKTLIILIFLFTVFLPVKTYAQSTFDLHQPQGYGILVPFSHNIKATPSAEGLVQRIIGNVIAIFYAVGGIGVVIYFVWGTIDWILSGGDKEKVSNARKKMTNAIIGLVLLSLSFVIINIVGEVVGFNPLSNLQLRGLGDTNNIVPNIPTQPIQKP